MHTPVDDQWRQSQADLKSLTVSKYARSQTLQWQHYIAVLLHPMASFPTVVVLSVFIVQSRTSVGVAPLDTLPFVLYPGAYTHGEAPQPFLDFPSATETDADSKVGALEGTQTASPLLETLQGVSNRAHQAP
jgi:hypothetical protein